MKKEISKIEDELEKLKEFYEKDYPFQVQDKVNSILALIGDCSQKSRICYNFYDAWSFRKLLTALMLA